MSWRRRIGVPGWTVVLVGIWLALGAFGCNGDSDGTPVKECDGGPCGPPANTCNMDADCKEGYYCYRDPLKPAEAGACAEGCRRDPDSCKAGCELPSCDPEYAPFCNESHVCTKVAKPCTLDPTVCKPEEYCDQEAKECKVGCEKDSECTAECQVCDLASHACVEQRVCKKDEDCSDVRTYCDTSVDACGRCELGCRNDDSCPDDKPFCDPDVHRCVVCEDCPGRCDDASADPMLHCPEGYYCDETNQCDPVCANDEECRRNGQDSVCCTEAGCPARRCVHRCEDGVDGPYSCPPPQTCLASGHCGYVCNSNLPTVEEQDLGCAPKGPEKICINFECVDGCRSDDDQRCEPKIEWCDTTTFTCQPGCARDNDCQPWESCLIPAHQCGPKICGTDENCPEAYYCTQEGVCSLGCRIPNNCLNNQVCRAPEHVCVDRCGSDDECGDPSLICVEETGLCEAGCRRDALEPNNLAEQATLIELRDDQYHAGELKLCGAAGDQDWFKVDLVDQRLYATIHYDPEIGDLSLELVALSAEGVESVLDVGANQGQSSQSVQFTDDLVHTGTYYLRVTQIGEGPALQGVSYELDVTVEGAGECGLDWAEGELGNNGWRTAYPLADGDQQNLWICPGNGELGTPLDEDWFSFDLQVNDGVEAVVAFPLEKPLRLELWAPGDQGPVLLVSGEPPAPANPGDEPPSGPKSFKVNQVFTRGTYFLRVYTSNQDLASKVQYSLRLLVKPFNARCTDDGFEPNDTPETAAEFPGLLFRQSFANLALCAGTEDWYQVHLQGGDLLRVTLEQVDPGAGNLDMELYQGGARVMASANDGQTEGLFVIIDNINRFADTYLVRIMGRDPSQQNNYHLTVSIELDPNTCPGDVLAPNQTRDTAARVNCGDVYEGLVSCFNEDDWFVVQTFMDYAGVTARIGYLQAAGELGLDLYRAGGELIVEGSVGLDETVVEGHGLPRGTYYLRVYSRGQPNRYQFEVACVEEEPPCESDDLEPNNVQESASPIALPRGPDGELLLKSFPVDNLRVCTQADSDWYQFQVLAGDHLDILTRFFHFSEGDLDIQLYCGRAEHLVATSSGRQDDENVVYDIPYGPCSAGGNCPVGQVCTDGICEPQCQDELECPVGHACEAGRCKGGVCGPECEVSDDCQAGFACNGNMGRCCPAATCINDCQPGGACGENQFCNADNKCCSADSCNGIQDYQPPLCPIGQSCVGRGCVVDYEICWLEVTGVPQADDGAEYSLHFRPFRPCVSSYDCLGDQVCDMEQQGCVEPCSVHEDCGAGTSCVTLRQAVDAVVYRERPCAPNDNPSRCSPNEQCIAGFCTSPALPAEQGCAFRDCLDHTDCVCPAAPGPGELPCGLAGTMCDAELHGCMFESCHSDYDCLQSGTTCDPITRGCMFRSCLMDIECARGQKCDEETGGCRFLPCSDDADCEAGKKCDNQLLFACVPL